MKKLALVLTVFTVSIFGVKAQIQFGLKAGANFSTFTGSDASGAKTLVGFLGGALVKIPLGGGLAVQPEVVYSGQGAKGSESGTDFTEHANYINIPVLVKYTLPLGLFVETGPQFGILASAKAKVGSTSTDIKSSFKSSDLDWAFGAGYTLPALPIGVDVRYNLGLSKIGKDQGSGTPNIKNGVFQLSVFYLFGGK